MSTDYGEKERQFLETLKADTGRALEDWLAAIAAEGLTHRNDIIDWLRRQGFMFSKASWIERIHNNGGRPIYAGAGSPRPAAARRTPAPPRQRPAAPPEAPRETQNPAPATAPSSRPPPAAPLPVAPLPVAVSAPAATAPLTPAPAPDPVTLEALLARAKAFRPLANYVIAEVGKAVPGTVTTPFDSHLTFHLGGTTFGVLTITAKELRLGLALKEQPQDAPLEASKLALRGAPAMSHMAVLTDARQITPALLAAVTHAAKGG